jgi:hypothetical protein
MRFLKALWHWWKKFNEPEDPPDWDLDEISEHAQTNVW